MDLITSIFDDKKATKRTSSSKKSNTLKHREKPKNISRRSSPIDKNKPARSLSQNNTFKDGTINKLQRKHDVKSGGDSCTNSVKEVIARNDSVKSEINPKQTIKLGESAEEPLTRSFSKYFEESSVIEDDFEFNLALYNDCVYDEKDVDFGRESFNSLDKDYFVEAYNREEDQICQTSVELEILTICSDDFHRTEKKSHDCSECSYTSDNEDDIYAETFNSLGNELKVSSTVDVFKKSTAKRERNRMIDRSSNLPISQYFLEEIRKRDSVENDNQEIKPINGTIITEKTDIKNSKKSQNRLTYNRQRSVKYELAKVDEVNVEKYDIQEIMPSQEKIESKQDSSVVSEDKKIINKTNYFKKESPSYSNIYIDQETIDLLTESLKKPFMVAEDLTPPQQQPNSVSLKRNSPLYTANSIHRFDSTSSTSSRKKIMNIRNLSSSSGDMGDLHDQSDEESDYSNTSFNPTTKSDMIVQELIQTERGYLKNLKKIHRDYIQYFKRLNLNGWEGMFGNISAIFCETRNFYESLVVCENNYELIAMTFLDYKHLFDLYPEYSKNKVQADQLIKTVKFKSIVDDRQRKLNDKLNLASYLLNPIQRLGRYILLLENLQKNIRKPECIECAIKLLKACMRRGNDYVAIDSIVGCPENLDLASKGSFIEREKFLLIKNKKDDRKREEIVIFLFENIIIFTSQIPDNSEKFMFKNSIDMNDLAITCIEGNDLSFHLKNYTLAKKEKGEDHTYIIEARGVKLKLHWAQLIQKRLWEQLKIYKANSKQYKVAEKKDTRYNSMESNGDQVDAPKSPSAISRKDTSRSDRQKVKRRSQFYVDSSGYDTL